MRQIVLDTETTGLATSQGHRIIEIGCLELVNRRLTGRELLAMTSFLSATASER
jgi:DNA polymerase III epsilon subunit-like protein